MEYVALCALVSWLCIPQEPVETRRIALGDVVRRELNWLDPVVDSPRLRRVYQNAMKRGHRYELELSGGGEVTIEMVSPVIDPYLVLRDATGAVIAEDDDSLYSVQAQIRFRPPAGTHTFTVEACGLAGLWGEYELRVLAGRGTELDEAERRAAAQADVAQALARIAPLPGEREVRLHSDVSGESDVRELRLAELAVRYRLEAALRAVELELGPDDPSAPGLLIDLANLVQSVGALAVARPLYERAVRIRKEVEGLAASGTHSALLWLAFCQQEQGDVRGALETQLEALEAQRASIGPTDSTVIDSVAQICHSLWKMGQHARAGELAEETLGDVIEVEGPEDERVATLSELIGESLWNLGRVEESEEHFDRALEVRLAVFGLEHPLTATALNDVAAVHRVRGRHREAQRLYRQALGIVEATTGPESADTAIALNNLGLSYWQADAPGRARPLYERALAIHERNFGPRHGDVLTTRINLANLLFELYLFDQAAEHYDRAYRAIVETYGLDSPRAAEMLNKRATAFEQQGRYEEASELVAEAMRISELHFGPDSFAVAGGLALQSRLISQRGDHLEALELMERVVRIVEAVLPPEHLQVAQAHGGLSLRLESLGRYDEALPHRERILEVERRAGSPREMLRRYRELTRTLFNAGEVERAWERSQEAIATGERDMREALWFMSESERLQYAASRRDALLLHLGIARVQGSEDVERRAYENLLRWKGRVSRGLVQSRRALGRDMSQEARDLLGELRRTQSQLSKGIFLYPGNDEEVREERLVRFARRAGAAGEGARRARRGVRLRGGRDAGRDRRGDARGVGAARLLRAPLVRAGRK